MITLRGFFAAIVNSSSLTKRNGISLLGYGAMRLPTVDGAHANSWADGYSIASLDQKRINKQVKMMLDGGINFFDTSPRYCRGDSEKALGIALKASGYERNKYFLSSKLSNFADTQWSLDSAKDMFEKSLKFLNTDYLDVYLLHNVGGKDFENRFIKNGVLDWVFEQKRQGRIKKVGFSIHGDPERFKWLMSEHDAGHYRWDVALIQANYVDWRHASEVNNRNVNAEFYYKELEPRGIKMMIMEPLLGGRLANPPEKVMAELLPLDPEATAAKWALRFCASHKGVMTVLSGMTYEEHIQENMATFTPFKPLTDAEGIAIERAAAAFIGCDTVPCNLCNYCMPCPYGLDIPSLITFINEVKTKKMTDRKAIRALYERLIPDPRRRADHCIGCARCNPHCPQHIDIPKIMDEIAAFTEEYA